MKKEKYVEKYFTKQAKMRHRQRLFEEIVRMDKEREERRLESTLEK